MSMHPSSQPADIPLAWFDPEAETVPPRPDARRLEGALPGPHFWWALLVAPTVGLLFGVTAGLVAALIG